MQSTTNRFLATLALASAGLCGSAAAQQEPPRLYAGGHLGANALAPGLSARVNFGAGMLVPGRIHQASGEHAGLFVGREYGQSRYELEFQAGGFDVTGIELGAVKEAKSAPGRYAALTLNANRRFDLRPDLRVFAGAGLGWAQTRFPGMSAAGGGCNCFPSTTADGFAWLGRIGLEHEFNPSELGFAQLTWLHLPGGSSGAATPQVSYPARGIWSVSVGWRHRF